MASENNSMTFIPGSQLWFIEGSKLKDYRIEAGINGPKLKKSVPMCFYPTIYQAQIHVIEIYIKYTSDRHMRRLPSRFSKYWALTV